MARVVDRAENVSGMAEQDVGLAGAAIRVRRRNDQVGETVAIEVAGRGDSRAGVVTGVAGHLETLRRRAGS